MPNETRRIDLALTAGIPGFIVTLRTVLAELQVQEALVAEDTGRTNPRLLAEIKEALGDARIKQITHQELKERCAAAKAVIRTGEFTPYANIILVAGVVF
jgi:D-ribose pyranase